MKHVITTIVVIFLSILNTNAQETITVTLTGPNSPGVCSTTQVLNRSASIGSSGGYSFTSAGLKIIYNGTTSKWELQSNSSTAFTSSNNADLPYPPCLSNGNWADANHPSVCFDNIVELSGDCGVSPLPVELLSFTASQEQQTVKLTWQTATEINNNYFEIERSVDGENFEVIGQVEGFGNTIEQQDYEYIDENIYNEKYYYRLKQVDFDGSFEYHQTTFVEINNLNNDFKIYPTITSDIIFIQSEMKDDTFIQVYNANGQLVKEFNLISQQMSIGDLPNGQYWLRILNNENAFNQLIIKL